MKSRHARTILLLCALFLVGSIAAAIVILRDVLPCAESKSATASIASAESSLPETPEATVPPTPEPAPQVDTVHFSATGDDLIHEALYQQADARVEDGYDFAPAYANLKDFYAGFDVNWLNQETLVNDAYTPSGYPCFSTPTDIGKALYDIGFRVFSLSNNHSYDKGADGIASSVKFWKSMPEDTVAVGLYDLSTYDNLNYQTVNGVKIGYLSYTEATNGIPTPEGAQYGIVYLSDTDTISRQMAQARADCDVLVVSCHWGVEGSHDVTDGQKQMAQWLCDQGADLIIGTHPHVTETAEWLTAQDGHTAFVAYSLGNFISAQSDADNMIGTILDISFQKTTQPDGTSAIALMNPRLHPVITQYENGYKNVRVYLYRDYTDDLAAAHGGDFSFSRSYIESVLSNSIDAQFLDLN
jgi:poly-gamma-glutamate synthesis protein (capsule biosynthesis protein)